MVAREIPVARSTDGSAARMVALIQQLYQVETGGRRSRPGSPPHCAAGASVPLLAKIDALRQEPVRTALPKSPLGDAIRYLPNQWTALQRFVVDDRRLAIDNNRAENQLRIVTVGRKNWLFAGVSKVRAGRRCSIHSSRAAN